MAKNNGNEKTQFDKLGRKRTTIGRSKVATAKLSKQQRRNHKPYRGQGKT